jgi:hypothetical protein
MCKAGPYEPPIPKEGRWYELTNYLWKRLRVGDAVEGKPPTEAVKADTKKSVKKTKEIKVDY